MLLIQSSPTSSQMLLLVSFGKLFSLRRSYCSCSVVDTETSLADEKKDERTRLIAIVREIERFLGDGLVKVLITFRG